MSTEPDYSIEALIRTFAEHAEIAMRTQQKSIELYQAQYPNSPLPEHFTDSFCIGKALSRMCIEIAKLKIRTKCLILTDDEYDAIQEMKNTKID